MNKKGFTLIELLAVVSIVALLVVIALPNVMNTFKEAKKKAFTTEVKQVYKVAESTWMQDSMFSSGEKVYSRCAAGCNSELDLSGRKSLEYYIKVNKAGQVVEFYATDGTYQFELGDETGVDEITDVKEVAYLDEEEIIKITPNGVEQIPYFCFIVSKTQYDYGIEDDWNLFTKAYIRYEEGMTWGEFLESSYNTYNGQRLFNNSEGDGLYYSTDTFYDSDFKTLYDNNNSTYWNRYHPIYRNFQSREIKNKSEGCYGNVMWVE